MSNNNNNQLTIQKELVINRQHNTAIKQIIDYLIQNEFTLIEDVKQRKTSYFDKYGIKRISNIEILATKSNEIYAIELDNKTPRIRTLKKLYTIKADHKIIFVKGNEENYKINNKIQVIYLQTEK